MKAKINKNRKPSVSKKLIPAAGSLAISATMLATSTLAWFTMSREVEVTNIKMTASVPEDMQISLGKLTDIAGQDQDNPTAAAIANKANNYVGLKGNQGRLAPGTGSSADDGGVAAPSNNTNGSDPAEDLYWANTADVSEYYRLGKIIPASSIDGKNLYFTPDASGEGKTLKNGAKFYQVASLASADFTSANIFKWDSTNNTYATNITTAGADEARTKLHAITKVDESTDPWNPAGAETGDNTYRSGAEFNVTNDDGYYVDIPVWIRSSSKNAATLSVDAYVTTNAGKTDDGSAAADDELYMAARAVIIYEKTEGGVTSNDSSNLLRVRKDSFDNTTSVTNFMYSTNNTGDAVSGISGTNPTYGTAQEYGGTQFLTVPARDATSTNKYGNMVKAVVRVWLEGEDPNCWNPNAGQDFNISLKFVKGDISSATAANNANGVAFPEAYSKGTGDAALDSLSNIDVDESTTVTIKETINGVANTEIKFTYDGNKWNQTTGSAEILNGKTYTISGNGKTGTVTGATEGNNSIAAWLKTNVTKKSHADDANVEYTITPTGS